MPETLTFEQLRPAMEAMIGQRIALTVTRREEPNLFVSTIGVVAHVLEATDEILEVIGGDDRGGLMMHLVAEQGQEATEPGFSSLNVSAVSFVEAARSDEGQVGIHLAGGILIGLQPQGVDELLIAATQDLPLH
jgi:hypothetical protein